MVEKNLTRKNHAAQFVAHLKPNERNALRIILMKKTGLAELRAALGTESARLLSAAEIATGLARTGRTIELFSSHDQRLPADLHAESHSLEVR